MEISIYPDTSPEQQIAPATRAHDVIGASEVAAIVGLSPFATPLGLALRKKGLATDEVNEQMRGGKDLEQAVAGIWARRVNRPIVWLDKTVMGPEPWIVATPDFEMRDAENEGGEVKTLGFRSKGWGEPGTDEVPGHVFVQAQWQMLVTKWALVNVVAFQNRDDIPDYVVKRDDELIGNLREAAAKFRKDYLLTDKLPPVTQAEPIIDSYIKSRYPYNTTPLRPATEQEVKAAAELLEAKLTLKELEEIKGRLETALKLSIGDAEGFQWNGGKITYKNVKPTDKIDWEALAMHLGAKPDDVAKFKFQSGGYRRFLLSAKEGK